LLREEASWQHGDRNARTIVQEGDLRISVVVLKQGAELREHRTAGAVSVQALTGRLRLRAAGESHDLRAGGLLVLDHSIPHEVEALEQSAFLLTVALPRSASQGA
jgi:quercetin dioxygenase-like cupin family protein